MIVEVGSSINSFGDIRDSTSLPLICFKDPPNAVVKSADASILTGWDLTTTVSNGIPSETELDFEFTQPDAYLDKTFCFEKTTGGHACTDELTIVACQYTEATVSSPVIMSETDDGL